MNSVVIAFNLNNYYAINIVYIYYLNISNDIIACGYVLKDWTFTQLFVILYGLWHSYRINIINIKSINIYLLVLSISVH